MFGTTDNRPSEDQARSTSFYGCTRRSDNQSTSFYTQRPSSQATNFYGRESSPNHQSRSTTRPSHVESIPGCSTLNYSPDHHAWQPGEYLNLPSGSTQQDVFSLVSEMQGVITAEIQKVLNLKMISRTTLYHLHSHPLTPVWRSQEEKGAPQQPFL